MRIGMIAPPWLPVPPPGYGGTELVLANLARGLHDAGHAMRLVASGDSTCAVPRRATVPTAERGRMGMASTELAHVVAAYEALGHCDLVHDHTLTGPLYAAAFADVPVVTTNHSPFDAELGPVYRALSHRVPVIAISRAQAAQAHGVRLAGVVHHGLAVEDFPFGPGTGGYWLFLGRMAPEKGAHRAALVARRAAVRLVLAAKMSEPRERAYFDAEVRPLLSSRITYAGEADHRDKRTLLAGATGLLNPIRWAEPFGLAMVEALACGTPVATFKEGAAPEIVSHGVTGFLCTDEDDMVDAVRAIGEVERAACRAHVRTHFSVERMVAGHLEVYGRVLDRRR